MIYEVIVNDRKYRLELDRGPGGWKCVLDGRELRIDAVGTGEEVISLLIDARAYEIRRERSDSGQYIWVGGTPYRAEVSDPRSLRSRKKAATDDESGPKPLVAAMAGKVVRVLVQEKQAVEAGQAVVAVEAMKMQNEIKSPKKGIIQKLLVSQGSTVNAGDVLAVVE
jgi:biotin carboxyl carrier protein